MTFASSGATFSRRTAMAFFTCAMVAASCARTDAPAEPVWGKEPCAHCKMLVSQPRYAAQVASDGERYFFDDIGCMVLWLDAHKPAERAWVHDATGKTWLDARTARYVGGARTPMDFGLEAHAAEGVSFDAARDAVLAKKRSSL